MSDGGPDIGGSPGGPDPSGPPPYRVRRSRPAAAPPPDVARRRQVLVAAGGVLAVFAVVVLAWGLVVGNDDATDATGTKTAGREDLTQVPAKATDQFVTGILRGYDVSDPRRQPPELWKVRIGGCIESTPSVWKGRVYFGTRAGKFFSLGDDGKLESPTAAQAGGGGGD